VVAGWSITVFLAAIWRAAKAPPVVRLVAWPNAASTPRDWLLRRGRAADAARPPMDGSDDGEKADEDDSMLAKTRAPTMLLIMMLNFCREENPRTFGLGHGPLMVWRCPG
jgi:hypothetical protein